MAARSDLLLTAALPPGWEVPVDVRVEDGRITAVGPGLEAPRGAPTLDAGARPVLPGLVEPHLHLDKALLDGREPADPRQHAERGTLAHAVSVTAELKQGFTTDDVLDRAGTVLGWALQHGTTRIRTPVDVDPAVGLVGLDALLTLRERWAGTVEIEVVAFPQEGIAARPGTHDLLVEALRRGADVIGACSYAEADAEGGREQIRTVLDLAERFDVPVDVHADFSHHPDDDPRHDLAEDVAHLVAERGMAGRVVLGHVTTLAGLPDARRARTLDALAAAGVGVVVLPPTDVYLQGRTAPFHELVAAGVRTAFSSNNVRNAFTPSGRADVLDVALLLARTAPVGTPAGLDDLLARASGGAAALLRVGGHDLAPGSRADLVVLDAPGADHRTALLDHARRRWVLSAGRLVATTETFTTLRTPGDAPIMVR